MAVSRVGQKLEQFLIVEKIGQGGMGSVWKAVDEKLGRQAAIKFLDKPDDATSVARFLQEAKATSLLNHPGIATVYEVVELDSSMGIVMEFVDGQPLHRVIPPNGLPINQFLPLAIELTLAVAHAHSHRVVHRDIKPGNIIVTLDGHAKLVDFGLAKLLPQDLAEVPEETQSVVAPHTVAGQIVGSINYMSPEQARGKSVDHRSDIFSLGAVLEEMWTGKKAFPGSSAIDVLLSIQSSEPRNLPAQTPPDLARIIQRCLRNNPDRRYQTARDLCTDLEDFQATQGAPTKEAQQAPATAVPSVPPRSTTTRWLAISYVATVALGLAAWFYFWPKEQPAPEPITIRSILGKLPGRKLQPSFSPDGNTIVFAWDGGTPGSPANIYAMLKSGEGQPLQLTKSESDATNPFYSPDGTRIFFSRRNEGVLSVPALGGNETRVTSGRALQLNREGTLLACTSTANELRILNLQTGKETILVPPGTSEFITQGSFGPEGKWFYYSASIGTRSLPARRIDIAGGQPEKVAISSLDSRLDQINWVFFPTSGKRLLAGGIRNNQSQTYSLDSEGRNPKLLPPSVGVRSISFDGRQTITFNVVRVVPLYRLLAFPKSSSDLGVTKVLDSPRSEHTPTFNPQRKQFALSSVRSGRTQIWLWDELFHSGLPIFDRESASTGSPVWSPNGESLALDARVDNSNTDIWIVDAKGNNARKVTTHPSDDIVPCFHPKGDKLFFSSNRTGQFQLFELDLATGKEAQLTKGGGFACQVSADGKFVYYLQDRGTSKGLYRIGLDQPVEESVLPELQNRNWKLLNDGIYILDVGSRTDMLVNSNAGRGIAKFYSFATRKLTELGITTPRPISPLGIELSPDRRWVYFSMLDDEISELLIAENLP